VPPKRSSKVYGPVIEKVFRDNYRPKSKNVDFTRDNVIDAATHLGVDPKNVGDLIYTFRYRRELPESIRAYLPAGHVWLIRGTGAARYRFDAVPVEYAFIEPRAGLAETKIPDSTPGVISSYALDDEQALLAKVRYNRLVDIFMGAATFSLQSHLRTQVQDIGQVETDEVYVGIDKQGTHYVFPVQAKGGNDHHNVVQIEQDYAMCMDKFPSCLCRPIAAQFMEESGDKIALFSFAFSKKGEAKILSEKHYLLVSPEQISQEDLAQYRSQTLLLS
jgi:hypothetical protein